MEVNGVALILLQVIAQAAIEQIFGDDLQRSCQGRDANQPDNVLVFESVQNLSLDEEVNC